jgi:hypothetical protein
MDGVIDSDKPGPIALDTAATEGKSQHEMGLNKALDGEQKLLQPRREALANRDSFNNLMRSNVNRVAMNRVSMSPPKRQPLERMPKMSLFDEWWISPIAEGEGFIVYGTEHSSYTAASTQRQEIIEERLSEKVLVCKVDGVECKVKLIGRMNEREMGKLYHDHIGRVFASGIPVNWMDMLRKNLRGGLSSTSSKNNNMNRHLLGMHSSNPNKDDYPNAADGSGDRERERRFYTGGVDDDGGEMSEAIEEEWTEEEGEEERQHQSDGINGVASLAAADSAVVVVKKRRPGRPPGSKNKPKLPEGMWQPTRKPGRPPGSKNKVKREVKKDPPYVSPFALALAEGKEVYGPPKRKAGRPLGVKNKVSKAPKQQQQDQVEYEEDEDGNLIALPMPRRGVKADLRGRRIK